MKNQYILERINHVETEKEIRTVFEKDMAYRSVACSNAHALERAHGKRYSENKQARLRCSFVYIAIHVYVCRGLHTMSIDEREE